MLMLGAKRAALASPIWTPRRNWPDAASPGFWLDPTSFASIYHDSAGTSPATAVEQPAGLVLDKRLGLVLGPESVPSTATTTAIGWSASNCVVALIGSEIEITSTAPGFVFADLDVGTVSGKTYRLSATYRNGQAAGYAQVGITHPSANTYTSASSSQTPVTGSVINSSGKIFLRLLLNATAIGQKAYLSAASVRELPGNHFPQATSTSRPIIRVTGFVQSLAFDGLDDGLSTGPIVLGADMDCFIAFRRSSTNAGALLTLDTVTGGRHVGYFDAAGSAACASYVGAAHSTAVNGVIIAGGAGVTGAQLHTATAGGAWHVYEARNLNLSLWGTLNLSNFPGARLNGGIAGAILCPAGSEATRAKNRKWLGAKVGLSLS